MRPWQAVAIATGSVLAWRGVRAAVSWSQAVALLSSPLVLVATMPAVLALSLLNRARLGRLTARGFVVLALLLPVVELMRPVVDGPRVTSLLMGTQKMGFFGPPLPMLWLFTWLACAWVLAVIWLVLVAWTAEPDLAATDYTV
jgi:hypothetical protein